VSSQVVREGLQAQDGAFEALRGVEALEARHVAGHVLRPAHLVHGLEVVHVVVVLAKPDARDNLEHVERDGVFLVKARALDVPCIGQEALQAIDLRCAPLGRRVG
jgi:hypothetical protein